MRWCFVFAALLAACGDSGTSTDGGGDASSMMETSASDGTIGDAAPDMQVMLSGVLVKVVDEFGSPVQGATVRIGSDMGTTASDGTCMLQAPPSYDVIVAYSAPNAVTTKRVVSIATLVTRSPLIEVPIEAPRQTSFNVTANTSFSNGDSVRLLYAPQSASSHVALSVNQMSSSLGNVKWTGTTPNTGTLFAYLVNTQNGLPAQWLAQSSSKSYSIADNGMTNETVSFMQGAVATANVGGTLDRSGQMNATQFALHVTPTNGGASRIVFSSSMYSSGTFMVPIPMTSTAGVLLGGTGMNSSFYAWHANITPNTNNVLVKLPSYGVSMSAPGANATADLTTAFSWSGPFPYFRLRATCGASAPYTFFLDLLMRADNTTPPWKATIKLPDTSAIGAALPQGATCSWQVMSFSGPTNSDEIVNQSGWLRRTSIDSFMQDGAYTQTTRAFKTN